MVLLGSGPAASGDHEEGWQLLARDVLWDGVEFTIVQEPVPVRTHVVHVPPGHGAIVREFQLVQSPTDHQHQLNGRSR